MKSSTLTNVDYVFVSNYWPPDNRGGFEIGCMRLAYELIKQGHSVKVVTSSNVEHSDKIVLNYKLLRFEVTDSIIWRFWVSLANSVIVAMAATRYKPKQLVFFGLQNVGYLMLFRSYGNSLTPFVYCSDETYVHWDNICRRILKNQTVIDRLLSLQLKLFGLCRDNVYRVNAMHTSAYILRVTPTIFNSFENNCVNHWGVNIDETIIQNDETRNVSICIGGRICHEKGTDIGLTAILLAAEARPDMIISVTILGNIPESSFGRNIRVLVESIRGLGIVVTEKLVRSTDVQRELSQTDVFILPSVWDEPFSIMLLEAMASRNFCVVTATGGSAEICNHMQTGYLCSDPTASEISKGIVWYLDNRSDGDDIAETAMSLIRSDYSMNKMASRFHNIVNTHGPVH